MLPCLKRQEIVTIDKDGSQGQLHRCANVQAASFAKDVNAEICSGCPLRRATRFIPPDDLTMPILERDFGEPRISGDGSIHYQRTGIEPPPPHPGYYRKSEDIRSDDAWIFLPLFKPCVYREMANSVRGCGCLRTNSICTSTQSGYEGQQVTPAICNQCQYRCERGQMGFLESGENDGNQEGQHRQVV